MSIIFEKEIVRRFNEEDFLLPQNKHCTLFGWINICGKSYTEDNTWEEEYWDGDGYSTRTHGSIDKYYPVYSITFPQLKNRALIDEKIEMLQQLPTDYDQLSYPPEPSKEEKRLARLKGEYQALYDNYYARLRATGQENRAHRQAVMDQFNQAFTGMVPLIYPFAAELPFYPVQKNFDDKQYKVFLKAAKKLAKEIEAVNAVRAARAFANCTNAEILALPKEVQDYLASCYRRHKNSTYRDSGWND